MARIPYVDPGTAPQAVRTVFERLPVQLHIFRLMAHAETCFRPLLRLGTAILGEQKLEAALREMAILRVARTSGAEYEWTQHVPMAVGAGVREEQIRALRDGRIEVPVFDDRERAVLRFTDDLIEGKRPSDETFGSVRAWLDDREIVELILAVGYYMALARLMVALDIDPDDPAGDRIAAAVAGDRGGAAGH